MNISMPQVREILRKDDFEYINSQITRGIKAAKASLCVAIGYKAEDAGAPKVRQGYEREFDELSDSYIIEHVRAFMDGVDNEKTLTVLAAQCAALIDGGTDA